MTTKVNPDDAMDTLTDNNGSAASLEKPEVAVVQS
jgi:hypothetical protein